MLTRAGKDGPKRVNFTENLFSDELVLHVFSFLSVDDLIRSSTVNSRWARLAGDPHLWKGPFLEQFRISPDSIPRGASIDWKEKYRVAHNWQKGKCQISHLPLAENMSGKAIQFSHDMLCLSNHSILEIWRIYADRPPTLLVQVTSSTESAITVLKLEKNTATRGYNRLVTGYADGGFGLWEFGFIAQDQFECREAVRQVPSTFSNDPAIVSVGVAYPLVITCTSDMTLSVFYVDAPSTRLVHRLQSPVRWQPLEIDIEAFQDLHQSLWRATICFAMSVGADSSSLGVQELVVSKEAMLMSRHCSFLNHDLVFFMPPQQTQQVAAGVVQFINGITYSKSCIMTAHSNNTITQYRLESTPDSIELILVRTLYGHTFGVGALSADMTISRLVSADQAGLKIWDLSRLEQPDDISYLVSIRHLQNQSSLHELPSWRTEWLDFDEEKVAAVVRDTQSNVATLRVWSFA